MTQQWKPIDSAPKDGTEILAWRSDCGQFIASYTSADAFPMTQDELDAWDEETLFAKDWFTQWPQALRLEGSEAPTHWMSLPAEPSKYTGDHDGMQDDPRTRWQQPTTPPASAQDATLADSAVICPGCAHQFRAIPVQIQGLLMRAGYEPPFLDASAQDDAKDQRQAFETWASNKGWPLSPYQNNCGLVVAERYSHRTVQKAWEAWQACATLSAPAAGDAPQDLLGRLANPLTPYGLLARALRVATGTTLMDMARATGHTPAEISSIEFGRKEPDESWFERAALFFASTSNGIVVPPSALKAAHKSRAASQQQEG